MASHGGWTTPNPLSLWVPMDGESLLRPSALSPLTCAFFPASSGPAQVQGSGIDTTASVSSPLLLQLVG